MDTQIGQIYKTFCRLAMDEGYEVEFPPTSRRQVAYDVVRQHGLDPKENPLRGVYIRGKGDTYFSNDFLEEPQEGITAELSSFMESAVDDAPHVGRQVHLDKKVLSILEIAAMNMTNGNIQFIDDLRQYTLVAQVWRKVR